MPKVRRLVAPVLLPLVAAALVSAVAGGLLRAGLPVADGEWLGRAATWHAALMVCGFMGTVIAVERAVALKAAFAWLAPVTSAGAAAALLAGLALPAQLLLVLAASAFVCVNLVLLRRQPAAHTRLLVGSALCWLAGNLLFALDRGAAAVPWWFAFLVWTIAAERLEMRRLMKRRRAALPLLALALLAMAAGAALSLVAPVGGALLYGASLAGLATWLLAFDVTRVTIRSPGLPRYMAVCLLTGYLWLAIAGLAWAAASLGLPSRDAALHALGIGFVIGMMMAHAPVILPAVAGVKLQFGWPFYLPLAALQLSLLARLLLGAGSPAWRAAGAGLNAAAMALFAATVVVAALAWARRHPTPAPAGRVL